MQVSAARLVTAEALTPPFKIYMWAPGQDPKRDMLHRGGVYEKKTTAQIAGELGNAARKCSSTWVPARDPTWTRAARASWTLR